MEYGECKNSATFVENFNLNQNTKISVCIATYNGEKYIKEQLDSILMQLGDEDEIIISDDHSTDSTLKIIELLNDKRIKIFVNNGTRGLTYNFENALKRASGDLIFLSDQDDIWNENKIRVCAEKLKTFDVVITDCTLVDENLQILNQSYFKMNNSKKGFFKNIFRSSYLGSCLGFRKEILNDVLPFPENLKLYHDWWIGIICDFKHDVCFIEDQLMLYRRHDKNMSTTGFKSKQKITKRIFDRVQLLFFCMNRLIFKK